MMDNGKLIVGGNQEKGFSYLYHRVIGDGHCFINCYLEATSSTYKKETNPTIKSRIARKTRIDFANFLMSESSRTSDEISFRLNILNPNILCNFFSTIDDNSSIGVLEQIATMYDENEDNNEETMYALLLNSDLKLKTNNSMITFEDINTIYKRDHRINSAMVDMPITKEPLDTICERYGVGKIPINIGFYQLATSAPTDYKEIINSVDILLSPSEFLNHMESSLFARYVGLNAIIFALGSHYRSFYKLIEFKKGAPELLMVNLGNIHWNLISFKIKNVEQLLLMGIPDSAKTILFERLTQLYNERKLQI